MIAIGLIKMLQCGKQTIHKQTNTQVNFRNIIFWSVTANPCQSSMATSNQNLFIVKIIFITHATNIYMTLMICGNDYFNYILTNCTIIYQYLKCFAAMEDHCPYYKRKIYIESYDE